MIIATKVVQFVHPQDRSSIVVPGRWSFRTNEQFLQDADSATPTAVGTALPASCSN